MTDQAQMSDLLLGFPGVMMMLALWNAATGFVWLPVMRNEDTWHAWPGVFVALALLLFAPFVAAWTVWMTRDYYYTSAQ